MEVCALVSGVGADGSIVWGGLASSLIHSLRSRESWLRSDIDSVSWHHSKDPSNKDGEMD